MAQALYDRIMFGLMVWAWGYCGFQFSSYKAIQDIKDSVANHKKNFSEGCPFRYTGSHWDSERILPLDLPDFYWRDRIIQIAEGVFFISRTAWAVPAGVLADLGHAKTLVGGGVLLMAASYYLLASFSSVGESIFIVHNVLAGCAAGTVFPSICSLLARITRRSDRNLAIAFVLAGFCVGHCIGTANFNYVYEEVKSWKLGQQTVAAGGLVWFIAWAVYAISYKYYTSRNLPGTNVRRTIVRQLNTLSVIPWRNIGFSLRYISSVLAVCSVSHRFYTVVGNYEMYVLRLPLNVVNYVNYMYIAKVPSLLLAGFMADWIVNHEVVSKTNIGRSLVFFGVTSSAIAYATSVTLAGCNVVPFWILTFIRLYTQSLATPVIFSTVIDINPRHAGLLMGIVTSVRTIDFILFNIMQVFIVHDFANQTQEKTFNLVHNVTTFLLVVPFLIFGFRHFQDSSVRTSGDDPSNERMQYRIEDQN